MKIVFTAGVMDLFHKGHLNILKEMRKEAGVEGKVIVILHDDKSIFETKGKVPLQHYKTRKRNLEMTGLVDDIIRTNGHYPRWEFRMIIDRYKTPNNKLIFMRGDDWFDFPAKDILQENDIAIKFISYTPDISSTLLRAKLETEKDV